MMAGKAKGANGALTSLQTTPRRMEGVGNRLGRVFSSPLWRGFEVGLVIRFR